VSKDALVACNGHDGAGSAKRYALRDDIAAPSPSLFVDAIELAKLRLAKPKSAKKNETAPQASNAFSAAGLATALVNGKKHDQLFKSAIDAAASRGKLPPEVAWVLINGERHYFLWSDAHRGAAAPHDPTPRPALAPKTPPHAPSTFAAEFDSAFDRVKKQTPPHTPITLLALRNAMPQYDRTTFDAGLRELRLANKFTLNSHEGGSALLGDAELDAGIQEGSSKLVYISRKS
jgi:hypothetical protein